MKKNNHHLSLRVPVEWDCFVRDFAVKWNTSPSYVYREAIRKFISEQVEKRIKG
jgi:predicted DNA-binding protein